MTRTHFSLETNDHGLVYLDGEVVYAIACDIKEGWVDCSVTEAGEPIKDGDTQEVDGEEIRRKKLFGKVEFYPIDSAYYKEWYKKNKNVFRGDIIHPPRSEP
jgi:hypothetical protein